MQNLSKAVQSTPANARQVLRFRDCRHTEMTSLLGRYQLELLEVPDRAPITGSYWGDEEAGLVGRQLVVRGDTPLHSILHEACHYACMNDSRRKDLHTNAGGCFDEENAVCYLQVLLADEVSGMGRARMFADMDTWGYSFRLGSARAWFERDAEDARATLQAWRLIDGSARPTFRLRTTP